MANPETIQQTTLPLVSMTPSVPEAKDSQVGTESSTGRELMPPQAAELERAVEDAGKLVSVINACAAEKGDSPPSENAQLEAQRVWYADAVFRYRHCIASKTTGITFEEDRR